MRSLTFNTVCSRPEIAEFVGACVVLGWMVLSTKAQELRDENFRPLTLEKASKFAVKYIPTIAAAALAATFVANICLFGCTYPINDTTKQMTIKNFDQFLLLSVFSPLFFAGKPPYTP